MTSTEKKAIYSAERIAALDVQSPYGFDKIIKASSFRHELSPSFIAETSKEALEKLNQACLLIEDIQSDVSQWYLETFHKEFDKFELGDTENQTREKFFIHQNFDKVCTILKIDPALARQLKLPWWSEINFGEISCSESLDADGKKVLSPNVMMLHSYHTQLKRLGLLDSEVSCATVSVSGVTVTKDNYIVIGLRGGSSYPNTYHINAGALKYDENLINDSSFITKTFIKTEQYEELGIVEQKATPYCRFVDSALAKPPGDINYFHVTHVPFARKQLVEQWQGNKHPDKKEHLQFIALKNNKKSVVRFIKKFYCGISKNISSRPYERRELLHPAAIALCAMFDIDVNELEKIADSNSSKLLTLKDDVDR